MPVVINGSTGITFPAGGTGNPAGTVVGTTDTQTLTNKTVDGSQLVAASVTSTQLATAVQPIGVGQTWQNVTGSRANGVTYTNTTGRPITIAVSASSSSASGNLYINGVSVFLSLCRSTYFNFVPIYGVVPPGGTYYISGFDYYSYWTELR